jgi:hypothetical protein
MRSTAAATCCATVAAVVLTLGAISAGAAEHFADVLRESGWDRLIGTWVGDNGRGGEIRLTYAWRFKDRVVEIIARDGDNESVSLVGYNPRTDKVFDLWADNQGGSGQGEWRLEGEQTVLDLSFVGGDGQEGKLKVRQRLDGNDAMTITVDAREPIILKMTRVKPQTPVDPKKPDAGGGR